MRLFFRKILLIITVLFLKVNVFGAIVDKIEVGSKYLGRNVNVISIYPEGVDNAPVLFLLHGHGGNESSWLGIKPTLSKLSDEYGIALICPDAENSWYWDSEIQKKSKYESFFMKELLPFLGQKYGFSLDRSETAITGLSMGGHGALWLAHRYPSIFGAVGSMSGGLDLRKFKTNWNLIDLLGVYDENEDLWNKYTVATHIDDIAVANLAIIIDCGSEDFFYDVNMAFHKSLLAKKVKHDYIIRPGAHNPLYWENAIDYQLLFFYKYFKK